MYQCGICEKEYETISERNKCEATCICRVEEEAKNAEEARKKAEQKVRKEEVDAAINLAQELWSAYARDYGTYEYNSDVIDSWVWPSKLFSFFI